MHVKKMIEKKRHACLPQPSRLGSSPRSKCIIIHADDADPNFKRGNKVFFKMLYPMSFVLKNK